MVTTPIGYGRRKQGITSCTTKLRTATCCSSRPSCTIVFCLRCQQRRSRDSFGTAMPARASMVLIWTSHQHNLRILAIACKHIWRWNTIHMTLLQAWNPGFRKTILRIFSGLAMDVAVLDCYCTVAVILLVHYVPKSAVNTVCSERPLQKSSRLTSARCDTYNTAADIGCDLEHHSILSWTSTSKTIIE